MADSDAMKPVKQRAFRGEGEFAGGEAGSAGGELSFRREREERGIRPGPGGKRGDQRRETRRGWSYEEDERRIDERSLWRW